MKNKINYERVMVLGEWLSRFLDYPWTQWEVEQLADDAILLLSVDYTRSKNDLFLAQNEKAFSLPLDKCELPANCTIEDHHEFDSDLFAINELKFIFHAGIVALQMYKDKPWEAALVQFSSQSDQNLSLLEVLVFSYNNIRGKVSVKEDRLVVSNEMLFPRSGADNTFTWVRLPALASQIFIYFLLAGGRDYCSFCKHCNKFILAERKGRKQFCSGRCRIAYKRKKDKEQGQP